MSSLEIIRLAIENLIVNKLRSGLTMLGMIIGVGAVVLLVSIGNGAKNYITGEFEGLGTNFITIQPGKTDSKGGLGPPMLATKRKLTLGDVDALEKQAVNLQAVSSLMFGAGTVKSFDRTMNINVMGCNEQFIEIFNLDLQQGQFISREESETGRRVAIIGHKVARELFGGESALGKSVKVNESDHKVIAVLQLTGEKLGMNLDELVIVPTRSAMRIFNDDRLFGIRAKARSKVAVDDAVIEIKEILISRHNGQEDFTIMTQGAILQTMNTILGMLTYVLAGIAMISMLVGGIGIMNIMLVSVTERTREIGIRRAVGARRKDILNQFLTEAVVLSFIGGLTGLLGSTFFTYLVSWLVPRFNMRAPLWILLPAFSISLVTGVLFGVWPARKAAHIETIEALRYE